MITVIKNAGFSNHSPKADWELYHSYDATRALVLLHISRQSRLYSIPAIHHNAFHSSASFLYRYPVQIHLIENTVQGFHRTLQIGSISLIEIETIFFQCLSGFFSFGNSLFCQIDICPAREAVFFIPCTLSVTK